MQSNRLSFWRPSRLPYIAVSDLVPPPVVVMATTGTCSTQQGRRSKSRACIRHKQPLLRKSDNRLQALIQTGMLLGMKRMWLLQKACLPLPDWYERESLCLTHSDGVGSCLLNIWLEINLTTLEFFSKCIIRSRHRKYRIYHTGADYGCMILPLTMTSVTEERTAPCNQPDYTIAKAFLAPGH